MNPLAFFASSDLPINVAPGTDFTIFGIHITNAMILGWAISLIIAVWLGFLARRVTVKPKGGVVQYVEAIVTFISDLVKGSFNEESRGRKYAPFFVTIFFFAMFNNLSELIPGVGSGIVIHGHPLLRPVTADLNMTLAMSLVTMAVVYASSIKEFGGFSKYISHFFMGSPLNPLYLVIGIIEMITDLTRALSLALRLFLNVTIGEIIIDVFAYLGGLLAPHSVLSPIAAAVFYLLEIGVDMLQAYIFVILAVNYLAIAVNNAHAHDNLTEDTIPETMGAVPKGAEG